MAHLIQFEIIPGIVGIDIPRGVRVYVDHLNLLPQNFDTQLDLIATSLRNITLHVAERHVRNPAAVRGLVQIASRFLANARCSSKTITVEQIDGNMLFELLDEAQSNEEIDLDEIFYDFYFRIVY